MKLHVLCSLRFHLNEGVFLLKHPPSHPRPTRDLILIQDGWDDPGEGVRAVHLLQLPCTLCLLQHFSDRSTEAELTAARRPPGAYRLNDGSLMDVTMFPNPGSLLEESLTVCSECVCARGRAREPS